MSYAHEDAWRFEVRRIGAQRAARKGNGYPTDDAARFAAFDAITDLLLAKARRAARREYVLREAA
ncbi:Adenine phosphoribosyltransferase [Ralstonia solanacearum]|nr:Adenine phosphoribosyltransferase [Ralstonia solanacearum]